MAPERERTVTVVSLVLTLIALCGYVTLSDGTIGTRVRAALGVDDRLRPPVDADGEGEYAFLKMQAGGEQPVGFSPCEPIHYVVNADNAPSDWEEQVERAIEEVGGRTGLMFEYDGASDDRNFDERLKAGARPEPVLIGWADEDEVGDLADDVAGIGGPTMVSLGRIKAYVTGSVILDTDTTDRLASTRRGDELQVALLLHELGHLVGLDHVDDEGELMYPEGITRPSYGPGDRQGLAELGAISCG